MRIYLLIIGLAFSTYSYCQLTVWQENKYFVDSLISIYRTNSKCFLTDSTLRQSAKKRRLDNKLIKFLNTFYTGELDPVEIQRVLRIKFRQGPWRFDESVHKDSFTVYRGRLRSFGNLEPFVTYVVLNNEVVGTHITIRIRSSLDCSQNHDGEIPDLLYLADLIPERINFPFATIGWSEYFDSKIWIREGLSSDVDCAVRNLIGKSSASPLKLTASHNSGFCAMAIRIKYHRQNMGRQHIDLARPFLNSIFKK